MYHHHLIIHREACSSQKIYSIFQGKVLLALWKDGWTMDILNTSLYVQARISKLSQKRPVQRRTSLDTFVHLKCNIYLSVTVHAKAAKCQCQIKGFWRTADSFQASEMACKNYRQSIFLWKDSKKKRKFHGPQQPVRQEFVCKISIFMTTAYLNSAFKLSYTLMYGMTNSDIWWKSMLDLSL